MVRRRRAGLGLAGAALLCACGGQSGSDTSKDAAMSADRATAARPAAFAVCASCHSADPADGNRVGPNLAGVVGAKAGARPGYNYSEALKGSGIVWTPDQLDRFIQDPRALVPGSKMMIQGPKDAAARKTIIDYLAATGEGDNS